jgi:hypothetical protein
MPFGRGSTFVDVVMALTVPRIQLTLSVPATAAGPESSPGGCTRGNGQAEPVPLAEGSSVMPEPVAPRPDNPSTPPTRPPSYANGSRPGPAAPTRPASSPAPAAPPPEERPGPKSDPPGPAGPAPN